MARKGSDEIVFGSDSFLDVVANVVGILIILVMMVGMDLKDRPVEIPADDAPVRAQILEASAASSKLEAEIAGLAAHSAELEEEASVRAAVRIDMQAAIQRLNAELESRRGGLDARSQQDLALQQEAHAAGAEVERLERELQTTPANVKTTKIESYPTPLARAVDGKEAHFQLKGGRIAYVPIDELLTKLKADMSSIVLKLREQPELTATVGPVQGFRMRYTIVRVDMVNEDSRGSTQTVRSNIQMAGFVMLPDSTELGETVGEALGANSRFRSILAGLPPGKVTTTLWAYPDSFGAFRALKKELYLLGYSIAGRPMPEGTPIGGSPAGTKSAAQ